MLVLDLRRKPKKHQKAKVDAARAWRDRILPYIGDAREQAEWFEGTERYDDFLDLVRKGEPTPPGAPSGPEELYKLLRDNLLTDVLRVVILPEFYDSGRQRQVGAKRLATKIASWITGVPQTAIEQVSPDDR